MHEGGQLGTRARAVIERARGGSDPTLADRERVRRRVAARLAAGVGAAGVVTAAAPAVAAWLKGVVVVAAVAGAVGAGVVVQRAARAPRSEAPQPAAAAAPAAPSALPPAAEPEPAVVEAPLPASPPKRAAKPIAKPVPRPKASPSAPAASATVVTDLGAETEALRLAHDAMQAAKPAAALAALDAYERRFPTGVLLEEARATRVLALCASGRVDEARRLADAFLARAPRSPLAARIRSSCAGR